MKLHKISHLLLFFILLFPASPIIITGCSSSLFARKPGTLSESELKDVLKEITVKVIVDDKEAASGTIIKKQNGFYTVLTNAHVIENAKSVKIVTPDNQVYPVEFSKVDRQDNKKDDLYDLAKLTFSSETTYLVAGLGEENIKPGEKVFAGGYVKGNLQTTKGTAKLFLNQPLIKGQQIAYDNDIQQGMSGGAIINEKGYLVGINSKLSHPVLQTDFRYLQGEQPDEKTLKEWGNYSWGIAVNLVDEAAPDLALFPERVIRKIGGIPKKVLDIAKLSSVQIKQASGGIGSGVIIAKDNDIYYVLTASHVVEDKQEYQVVAPDKQVYKVDNQTIRTREGLDMAVLQFRSSQVYQVATLGDYKLSDNSPVVFLYGWKGEELNYPSLFSVGFMQNIDANKFWAKPKGYELAYTNEAFPGMSGGGIWDTEGKLIGIHNASETEILGFSLGLSIQTFLFYEKDRLWNLPESSLTIDTEIQNSLKEITITIVTTSPGNIVNNSGNDWLDYGIKIWRNGHSNEQAINAMRKALTKNPNLWQVNYNIGFIKMLEHKYDDALAYINNAIEQKPTEYRSYLIKGAILQQLKQYSNALNTLNKGIKEVQELKQKQNDYFWLYQLRGEIFSELNLYKEAISDYSQAISINPQNADSYNNRGTIYGRLGNFEKAIQDFNQTITINPQYATAYFGRGLALSQQEGKSEKAIQDFNQTITINPQYADAYYLRGLLHSKQGKIDAAIQDFNQAIKINPQFTNAYFRRGLSFGEQGKIDAGIQDFNQVIRINPQYANAYYLRGLLYSKQGKIDTAIQDFNRAIKINPQYADAYYLRGVSYHLLKYLLKGNKQQQAIKDLETAKQLYQKQGNIQKVKQVEEFLNQK